MLTAAAGLLLLGTAPMAWQRWLAPPWGEVTAQVMAGCDLHQGACRATFPDGSAVELALAPRPIPDDAAITLRLRTADFTPRSVDVDLNGETMNMGPNRTELTPVGEGEWSGSTALNACVTGRMTWVLSVRAKVGGGVRVARFRFEVGH